MPELRWILIVAGVLILLSVYLWGRRISPRAEEKETILRSRAEPLITEAFDRTPSDDYTGEPSFTTATKQDFESQAVDDSALAWPDIDEPALERRDTEVESDNELLHSRREPVMSAADDLAIDADDEPTLDPRTMETSTAPSVEPADAAPGPAQMQPVTSAAATATPRARPTSRKILVLRLAAGNTRIEGDRLRAAFTAQGLVFGKYEIFHHLHASGATVFSVASMVEPGSFDPQHMDITQYPGVTLFAQLPGPLPGDDVFEALLSCAKQLQSAVGGTLQDDRGALLNSPRIQRLRQEVADFEHLHSAQADGLAGSSVPS